MKRATQNKLPLIRVGWGAFDETIANPHNLELNELLKGSEERSGL